MKIKMQSFLLCFSLIFVLCACGHSSDSSSAIHSISEESSVAPSSSSVVSSDAIDARSEESPVPFVPPLPSSVANSDAKCTVNYEVFDLVGGQNSQLLAYRDEACSAHNVGEVTEALTLYHPYLFVYYESQGMASYTVKNFVGASDLKYQKNPYVDDLQIKYLYLRADYDGLTHKVVSQDSLKQLFETDDVLTYELISACLGERPPLQHSPESNYGIIFDFQPMRKTELIPIAGGCHETTYIFEGKKIWVSFIKEKNDYIALKLSVNPE